MCYVITPLKSLTLQGKGFPKSNDDGVSRHVYVECVVIGVGSS
jgi:hypothetical protein